MYTHHIHSAEDQGNRPLVFRIFTALVHKRTSFSLEAKYCGSEVKLQ